MLRNPKLARAIFTPKPLFGEKQKNTCQIVSLELLICEVSEKSVIITSLVLLVYNKIFYENNHV